MARLTVISKNVTSTPCELGENWVTIGRGDGNVFQLVETSVSGRHCEVRLRGDELLVRDLLSTNGIFINGKKVVEGTLKHGEILRVGDVELRFENVAAATPGTSFISKMLVTSSAALSAGKSEPPAKVAEAPPAAPDPSADAAKKFQVLFVDDSLAFLESFGGVCAEYGKQTWAVHTAHTAERALQIMQNQTIHLVVLDIGMPMIDGLQLLGIIRRRLPDIKIAILTGRATEARRTDALANGADLFLEKPLTPEGMQAAFNVLNNIVSWMRGEGFTGSLRNVGLQEVIQMECHGGHSSVLEIRNSELHGQIYIESGAITHAAVGSLAGEPAFQRLLSLRGGEFQLNPFKAPPQKTIEARWEFLLMDAARLSDEETAQIKKSREPDTEKIQPAKPPEEDHDYGALGEDLVVVATYDGKWHPVDGGKK
jgi:CheY-like chemotaxis protein